MQLFAQNCWIFAVFIGWTALVLPLGWCCVLVWRGLGWRGGTDAIRIGSYCYARALWLLLSPVLPVHTTNATEAQRHAPCVIVANHQSFLDLFLFGMQANSNFCYLSKSWPYRKLFFFAPIMRYAEYVDVEALAPEQAEEQCRRLLKKGVSLVIFPEGRRTRDGTLGAFHSGAFRIACAANVPVVPLVIANSGAVFPVGGKHFTPQPLRLELKPALFPRDFTAASLPHRALMRAVREVFVRALQPTNLEVTHAQNTPSSGSGPHGRAGGHRLPQGRPH